MKIVIGKLELAQFTAADTEDLYRIRDHESVRAFMSNPAPLEWDSHVAWVRQNLLEGGQILLLIVRLGGAALGFTLLKRLAEDAAEVGVVLREAPRHRLIASEAGAATLYLGFEMFQFKRLVSYVVPTHAHAIEFNSRAGGREVPSDKQGMLQFNFSGEGYLSNRHCQRIVARMRPKLQVITE
jgi:RimJ/RimL family protein N-acetyltransferase